MTPRPLVPPILIPDVYEGDHDGKPDWDALAADRRFFGAIIKATEGTDYPPSQSWFRANWPAVRAAGGDRYGRRWFRGCYHYLQFDGDPVEQARYYLAAVEAAGGWDAGDLIPIVDVERGRPGADNRDATAAEVIACTSTWVSTVKGALGCKVMLYGKGAMRDLGITHRMGCDYLWAPEYGPSLRGTAELGWSNELIALWQYTDGDTNATAWPASAPGLGTTDLSVCRGDQLEKFRATVLIDLSAAR